LALEAFLLLGVMRAAILLLPFRWIVRLLRLEPGKREAEGAVMDDPRVADIGWAIAAAAARTPWRSSCLAQAFCGSRMLGKRGIPSTLSLGVAKGEPGGRLLNAHAWLCCSTRTVTGEKGCGRFTLLAAFHRQPTRLSPRCRRK
jgi:hypothetical protein